MTDDTRGKQGSPTATEGPVATGGSGAPVAVLVFDPTDRLVSWNEAAAVVLNGATHLLNAGTPFDRFRAIAGSRIGEHSMADGGRVRLFAVPAAAQRELAEADLATARREAERAARMRSRFFAVASHDLRQPLSALSLFLGALDNRVQDRTGRDILKAMGGAVQAMKGLVDAHLDIARIDAGTLKAEPGVHAANGLLTRLAMEFAPQFEDKGLRFTVQPSSALIRTDRDLLERVLRNFLDNALRYTDRGRVVLGCRRRGDTLRFEVWDTGYGIPPERLHAILEEFHPDQDPTRQVFQGLGLGLTVADRLARLLGHRLVARSIHGRGSVFTVIVPRLSEGTDHLPAAPGGTAADDDEPDVSRTCVLVIEDDPLVLDALALLLQQWGCEVMTAESYDRAMEKLEATGARPDLVVADFRLKGAATGIAAIRQIAKRLETDIPGLILTGDTDPRRLREAKLSGYPLLHKPVTPLALRAVVGNLLGRDRLQP